MRANRTPSIRVLMLVGFAIGVAGLMGCKKAPPATTGQALGGPVPGPIIDTSGDPTAQLTHRYDETEVKNTSAEPYKLDKRFFKKMSSAMLVNTNCGSGGPKVYGLANGVVVTVSFDDNTSYQVTIGDTTKEVAWACVDAGGNKTPLVKGKDDEIPNCMRTSTRKLSNITSSTGKTGQLFIIKTEK